MGWMAPRPPIITQDIGMSQAWLGKRLLAPETYNSQAVTHDLRRQQNRFQDGGEGEASGRGYGGRRSRDRAGWGWVPGRASGGPSWDAAWELGSWGSFCGKSLRCSFLL